MPDRHLLRLDPLAGASVGDLSAREPTQRRATARCRVQMQGATCDKVATNAVTKGDVLATARVAGIQAAKRAADLLPMCHPVLLGTVAISFTLADDHIDVEAQVETVDRTGVEMEAMLAASVAGLTIYDMCKSFDRTMVVDEVILIEKSGGRSGPWRRPESD